VLLREACRRDRQQQYQGEKMWGINPHKPIPILTSSTLRPGFRHESEEQSNHDDRQDDADADASFEDSADHSATRQRDEGHHDEKQAGKELIAR
jgi:hypothetical protein